jgi:large subunit ribosomal protein L25
LPESLVVDVSHLEIGQAVHIGDIKAPPGVEILGDKHISVLSCAAPITEAEEAAALEAATVPVGEVEMIKEKKEEGAEGEVEPADKAAAKPGEKMAAKPDDKTAVKPGEKAAAKPGEKAPPPAAEKPGEKKAERKTERRK